MRRDLLISAPLELEDGGARFYVDGRRVPFDHYQELERCAHRADTFHTRQHGNRWHFRKVVSL